MRNQAEDKDLARAEAFWSHGYYDTDDPGAGAAMRGASSALASDGVSKFLALGEEGDREQLVIDVFDMRGFLRELGLDEKDSWVLYKFSDGVYRIRARAGWFKMCVDLIKSIGACEYCGALILADESYYTSHSPNGGTSVICHECVRDWASL